ncbi:MAG: NUDIX domain-containing protein [Bacteroidota bacterium]
MKQSFGILLYKFAAGQLEFLLVHPGGPFWKNKHSGTWSVPKGEGNPDEDPLSTAIREFEEETGLKPHGDFIELKPILQKGGKQVFCWAVEGNFDPSKLISNRFDFEWPPRSGKIINIPEVDEARWFNLEQAKVYVNEKQVALLDEAAQILIKEF